MLHVFFMDVDKTTQIYTVPNKFIDRCLKRQVWQTSLKYVLLHDFLGPTVTFAFSKPQQP